MAEGGLTHHTGPQHIVSALRTALVGRAVVRFDGPRVDGPAPTLGRVIERVHRRGRRILIVWDDGLILHSRLGLSGVWHLYRDGEPWHKPFAQARVVITVPGWVAACFNAPVVETYREFDRLRHPAFGRSAPDLALLAGLDPRARGGDVADCARRLRDYDDPDAPVAEALLDPHVVLGLGNVHRSEVLWRCGLHPFARVGDLTDLECVQLLEVAVDVLRRNAERATGDAVVDTRQELIVYGRNGQRCARCGDTIEVCRIGDHRRVLYWCAGCQIDHDPWVALGPGAHDGPVMDPHPAATRFVADLPWRRSGLAG